MSDKTLKRATFEQKTLPLGSQDRAYRKPLETHGITSLKRYERANGQTC